MIRAICFDFDGTLTRFTGDFGKLLNEGFAKLGLASSLRETVLAEYKQQLRKEDAVTSHSALIKTLESLSLRVGADLKEINTAFVRAYREQMELLPGAQEVLELCRDHVPLALITNGPEDMQRAAVEEVDIAHFFQTILISGAREVAVRKPSAQIFQLACERLDVLPEEVLMVGDNLEADIRGALGAGMKAVQLSSEPTSLQAAPRVADLFQLEAHLRDLLT